VASVFFLRAITVAMSGLGTTGVMIRRAFRADDVSVYSVAAAHAHDFASERIELSAALMFFLRRRRHHDLI
jgi:hypothetical protein